MLKNFLYKGEQLVYDIRGAGKSIMLVHGFTEDRKIWDPLLEKMESGYQWILPDLPGSGGSAFNPSLKELTDFADALFAIVQQENIQHLILIGHSMGGYISLAFAAKYPERLRALGLFHSSAYADTTEKKDARDKNIRFIQKYGPEPFIEQSLPGLYSEGFKSSHPEEIRRQIIGYANFQPESLVLYLTAMKNRPETVSVLNSFNKPILFIIGEEDKAVPMKDSLEQSHMPTTSFIHILSYTAHMGMIESTGQSKSILSGFLQEIPD
jgi:pimeloyl-ACP methyl ester carboxylesterase